MHYTKITAGELRKMDGVRVKAETDKGIFIEGEIAVEDYSVFILHNNELADGFNPGDTKQYSYSWCLFGKSAEDDMQSINTNRIETLDDKFTEGEEVYVSDESVDDAINNKYKMIYICTSSSGKNIVQGVSQYNDKSYRFYSYKYIAKIHKEEPVEEMTMEQLCKALGKKIKIIE